VNFSRLSLLWKILIPTSLVMTVVFIPDPISMAFAA